MKVFRGSFFLLVFAVWAISPDTLNARERTSIFGARLFSLTASDRHIFSDFHLALNNGGAHPAFHKNSEYVVVKRPTDGGIKEDVPAKFQNRYQDWKNELLSTAFGRRQWENYSNNKQFILTVTFGNKEGQGAGTGSYLWDETGALVGATITLGNKLDKGLPNAVYFPVMNSLASDEPKYKIDKNLLAAAKLAHEFGHVNQTARMNGALFQLQNNLMPVYNEILLKNGYNTRDQNLVALTAKMGGTPVEIWESREYWGETNAMLYLFDRLHKENFYCPVFNKIKRNIALYAKDYEDRFEQIEDAEKLITECQ